MTQDRSTCGYFGFNSDSRCGYCKKNSSTKTHASMVAYNLTVDDYQMMIDRGWRRSGTYCYKPIMDKTCCPAYAIKCDATQIKLAKSQKKILRRFNKYLCSNESIDRSDSDDDDDVDARKSPQKDSKKSAELLSTQGQIDGPSHKTQTQKESNSNVTKTTCKKGLGADPSKAPCKKAKLARQQRKEEKLKAKGIDVMISSTSKQQEKSIEDFINELPENVLKKLQIKLVKSYIDCEEWKETEDISYYLYRRYQMDVHKDSADSCKRDQFLRFLVRSPLKVRHVKKDSESFKATLEKSSNLYTKYQKWVHSDDSDLAEFLEFLVDTPLRYEKRGSIEYGSFHQQYWLDDDLIAVGVLDILPQCVSSVYFFYNPEYNKLSIGTYGALREIEYTRQLQKTHPDIKNYYMGLYIHSCVKMNYKAKFFPSYLLCPETYEWFPIQDCLPKLDASPYSRLNNNIDAIDVNFFRREDLNQISILLDDKSFLADLETLRKFVSQKLASKNAVDRIERLLEKYGNYAGRELAKRIIICF